jgi:hypothetical protein
MTFDPHFLSFQYLRGSRLFIYSLRLKVPAHDLPPSLDLVDISTIAVMHGLIVHG